MCSTISDHFRHSEIVIVSAVMHLQRCKV
jgi:hypothetical protein